MNRFFWTVLTGSTGLNEDIFTTKGGDWDFQSAEICGLEAFVDIALTGLCPSLRQQTLNSRSVVLREQNVCGRRAYSETGTVERC